MRLSVFISTFISFSCLGQTQLSGQLHLDSSWTKEIYISKVPTLYDMYNSANHLIIATAQIDSNGIWKVRIPILSNPELIRLHIKKNNDPVTSLTIGNKDENFGFVGIGGDAHIEIHNQSSRLLPNFGANDRLNLDLHKIDSVIAHWENLDNLGNSTKEKISIRKVAAAELLNIADTSTAVLPAIYAAHSANFGFNEKEVRKQMAKIEERFGANPYLLPYDMPKRESWNPFLVIASVLISLFIIFRFYRSFNQSRTQKIASSLSYREKEVFTLVLNGKTNKEISSDLNIEPSTVKTHLKNIFYKLKVNSRNELAQYRKWVE